MYSTIVSIVPAEIRTTLPHTTPAYVNIPAAENDKPVICVLTDGIERRYIGIGADEKNPWTEYPVSAEDLSKAIVNAYKTSAIYVEPNAFPGVFVVEGRPDFVTPLPKGGIFIDVGEEVNDWVKESCEEEMKLATTQQDNWFRKLIAVGDRSFAKNNNYAEISTLQRTAAKRFALERVWSKEIKPEDFKKCPACMTFVDPAAIICKDCHTVIDVARYKELNKWKEPNESGNVLSALGVK